MILTIERMAMHRMISIMVGMPSPLAHEDDEPRDEDHLSRERDDDHEDGNIPDYIVLSIARVLQRGGPTAIRSVRLFARHVEDMAQAAMSKDSVALEEAASDAADAHRQVCELIGEYGD